MRHIQLRALQAPQTLGSLISFGYAIFLGDLSINSMTCVTFPLSLSSQVGNELSPQSHTKKNSEKTLKKLEVLSLFLVKRDGVSTSKAVDGHPEFKLS